MTANQTSTSTCADAFDYNVNVILLAQQRSIPCVSTCLSGEDENLVQANVGTLHQQSSATTDEPMLQRFTQGCCEIKRSTECAVMLIGSDCIATGVIGLGVEESKLAGPQNLRSPAKAKGLTRAGPRKGTQQSPL